MKRPVALVLLDGQIALHQRDNDEPNADNLRCYFVESATFIFECGSFNLGMRKALYFLQKFSERAFVFAGEACENHPKSLV